MEPLLLIAVGGVTVLTTAFSTLTYFWGASDTKKKLLSEKYSFGEKKYDEGYTDGLEDKQLYENIAERYPPVVPETKKVIVVKKFKKGKK